MTERTKILLVTAAPLSVGGVESHLLALAAGLKDKYSLSLIGDLKAPFNHQWEQLGLRVHPHSQRSSFSFSAVRQIRELIRAEKPDVIHIHDSRASFAGRLAKIGFGVPVVCSNHYPSYQYVDISQIKRIFYREVERGLNWLLTDWAVYLFYNTYQYAVSRMIAPRTRARVIQTGIKVETFLQASKVARAQSWHVREEIRLLIVARLTHQKRVNLAIQTTALLLKQGYPVILSIVGDGPERELLEDQADRLGISGKVEFFGFRADIAKIMAQADIFLLTSRFEGGPYVLMEAMAAGLPCVSIDIGDAALMLVDKAGVVIPKPDPVKFAAAAAALIEDSEQRKEMGIRAQEKAAAEFSIEKMIAGYDQFYQEIVRGTG